MKVKILNNVVTGQKVLKKDQVVDVDRKTASLLIEGGHAEETDQGSAPQQQQQKPAPKE